LTGRRNRRTMRDAFSPEVLRDRPDLSAIRNPEHRPRLWPRVMVENLARRFEVSAQTIRKDLDDLCDRRSLTS
jgi:DeoR-like helix-turn-helix domain